MTVLTLDSQQALFLFFKYNADLKQSICLSLSEFKNNKKTKSKNEQNQKALLLLFCLALYLEVGGGPSDLSNYGFNTPWNSVQSMKASSTILTYPFTIKHLDDVQPSLSFTFQP